MTIIPAKNQSNSAISALVAQARAHASTKSNAGSALAPNLGRFPAPAELTQQQKVEKQVRNWVGESFYGTMLKQMRNDPFKSELFDGGKGGEAYGQMFDQRLAQHMAGGVGSKIVRPMVKAMMGQAAKRAREYSKQSKTNQGSTTQEQADVSTDRRA